MLYKEHVQYKEAKNALEKEKAKIFSFKDSMHQPYSSSTIESIAQAMLDLSHNEGEIKKIKGKPC